MLTKRCIRTLSQQARIATLFSHVSFSARSHVLRGPTHQRVFQSTWSVTRFEVDVPSGDS